MYKCPLVTYTCCVHTRFSANAARSHVSRVFGLRMLCFRVLLPALDEKHQISIVRDLLGSDRHRIPAD